MIINLISGPRNISTALMYSFAQRDDSAVIDEPFYGYYLKNNPVDHPGGKEIIERMLVTEKEIVNLIHSHETPDQFVFIKNMAHHHSGLNWEYMLKYKNVFLVRDPKQLIASFSQVIPNPTLKDIGLADEAVLHDYLKKHGTFDPIVVDSNDILKDPDKGLRLLCKSLNIPFQPHMLSWKKGGIKEDGVWAKYWYANVHNSTGFTKQSTSERELPDQHITLYREALPFYQKLKMSALII